MNLCALPAGETARVREIAAEAGIRQRLGDLGLITGTRVTCEGKSPLGDPTAYRIRGTVIALRKEDAAKVFVEREG